MTQSELLIIKFNSFFNHLFLKEPVSLRAIQQKQNPLIGQTVATIVFFIQKKETAGGVERDRRPSGPD